MIFSYSAIPCYSNYANPNATKIELSGVQSQHELIVFRPGIAAKANGDDGQLFDKISVIILLLNDSHATLTKDMRHLRDLEAAGKLFV